MKYQNSCYNSEFHAAHNHQVTNSCVYIYMRACVRVTAKKYTANINLVPLNA